MTYQLSFCSVGVKISFSIQPYKFKAFDRKKDQKDSEKGELGRRAKNYEGRSRIDANYIETIRSGHCVSIGQKSEGNSFYQKASHEKQEGWVCHHPTLLSVSESTIEKNRIAIRTINQIMSQNQAQELRRRHNGSWKSHDYIGRENADMNKAYQMECWQRDANSGIRSGEASGFRPKKRKEKERNKAIVLGSYRSFFLYSVST